MMPPFVTTILKVNHYSKTMISWTSKNYTLIKLLLTLIRMHLNPMNRKPISK